MRAACVVQEELTAMTIEKHQPVSDAYDGPSIKELRSMLRQVMGTHDDTNAKLGVIEVYLKRLEGCISVQSAKSIDLFSVPIAYNLDLQPRFDDSLAVSINGGTQFVLGRRLAGVFLYIALGDADCGDGDDLVGWRSREAIMKSLKNFTGRRLRISYVNNLINLLKKKLKKNGYDANLIQSHREQGYRLAVKRRSARSLKGVSCDAWL
jgi:hypothetical protein